MSWQIVDWEKFEPKRSDRPNAFQSQLPYIMVRCNQNLSYKRLVRGLGGAGALGVWLAILEFWGRQSKAKRQGGALWNKDKYATIADIAADTLLSEKAIRAAIPKLCAVQWLQELVPTGDTDGVPVGVSGRLNLNTESESESESEDNAPTPLLNFGGDTENPGVVMLTQSQWHKLGSELGETTRNEMIEDANNYFHQIGPKAVAKRYQSHYHVIRSWDRKDKKHGQPEQKEQSRLKKSSALLDEVAKAQNSPEHIKAAILSLIGLFPYWPINKTNLGFWCYRMRELDPAQARSVLDSIANRSSGPEPSKPALREAIRDIFHLR